MEMFCAKAVSVCVQAVTRRVEAIVIRDDGKSLVLRSRRIHFLGCSNFTIFFEHECWNENLVYLIYKDRSFLNKAQRLRSRCHRNPHKFDFLDRTKFRSGTKIWSLEHPGQGFSRIRETFDSSFLDPHNILLIFYLCSRNLCLACREDCNTFADRLSWPRRREQLKIKRKKKPSKAKWK